MQITIKIKSIELLEVFFLLLLYFTIILKKSKEKYVMFLQLKNITSLVVDRHVLDSRSSKMT